MASTEAKVEVPKEIEAQRKTQCPDNVLVAIYGDTGDKKKAYDASLNRYSQANTYHIFLYIARSRQSVRKDM
jgi:hypothetical protein